MEIERGLPSLLQGSPRGVLLGSVPILSKRGLAEQCRLSRMRTRLFLENGDKRTARRRQTDIFEQSHAAILIDHCFKRLNHVQSLSVLALRANAPAGRKHQAIQRDNKNSAVAFDLAYDEKISRSLSHARYRQRGNNHRAQNCESKTASARNTHHAHEQPLAVGEARKPPPLLWQAY